MGLDGCLPQSPSDDERIHALLFLDVDEDGTLDSSDGLTPTEWRARGYHRATSWVR